MRGSLVLPGRGNATTLACCTMSNVQEGTWGRYLTRRAPSWKRNPLHGGGQQGSHQHIHLPGLPFSNGAARSSRSSHSSDCVCITRFGVGAAGLGATLGLAMLPGNHATHDSTMESYTTSISWRSLEARRNKTGAAMHFLSSSRPPSELGRVFLVPVQPRETVFPARILSRCRDPKTVMSCQTCLRACLLEVLEHILFLCMVQAYEEFNRVGPCRSLLPVSCCNSGREPQQRVWHFGTVIGNQNLLRLFVLPCPPLPLPVSPFRLDLNTVLLYVRTHNSESAPEHVHA